MKQVLKKVKLLKPFDVDNIDIRRDRYFHDTYIVDLPLDSIPDHVWQDVFERTWKSSRHLWDRKLFVISDKLRLVTPPDEFEGKLDWIEHVIDETNKSIDELYRALKKEQEKKMEKEIEKQKRWEEKASVEMIRDILRKRFAPV